MTDLKTLTIIVEPATFTMNRSGSVIGNIFLKLNGAYFPDHRWSDFPVPVLSWWMESILPILSGQQGQCDLLFMDGSQFIRLTATHNDVLSVAFLTTGLTDERPEPPYSPIEENGSRRSTDHEYDIFANPFITSLLDATDAVIEECAKRDFRSKYIAELGPLRDRLLSLIGDS
jgi:hypothetical protein